MYFNNANDQLQKIREHLLLTHMVIEPFGIALTRRLSKNHPIYRFLFPHLHTTSAINYEVKFLINGVIDKLFSIGKAQPNTVYDIRWVVGNLPNIFFLLGIRYIVYLYLKYLSKNSNQNVLGAKGAIKLLQQEFNKFNLTEFNERSKRSKNCKSYI